MKSLEDNDSYICKSFYPNMFDEKTEAGHKYHELREDFGAGVKKLKSDFDFYNLVEKCILEIDLSAHETTLMKNLELKDGIV